MQHGLSQWLVYLSDKSLPLFDLTRRNVQSKVDQPQLSITQYALPVLPDTGFAAYIFHHVNAQRVAAGRNPLTTLDNALSHLGSAAFQSLLNGAPVFEKLSLDEKNRLGYIRVMGQACHAGLQARDWGKQRGVIQAEEMQLAASLQSITELMLWCYGGSAMREIEYLHYIKKKKYEDAANKVLGCTMRELGAALAARWELPEMVVDGLKSRHDNFTLATGVSLAAELSRVVARNWYGKQAKEIIQRISKYKARPEGEINRQLHLNAVSFTGDLLEMGYTAPAKLIPMLAADDFIDSQYIFHKKDAGKHKSAENNNVKGSMSVKENDKSLTFEKSGLTEKTDAGESQFFSDNGIKKTSRVISKEVADKSTQKLRADALPRRGKGEKRRVSETAAVPVKKQLVEKIQKVQKEDRPVEKNSITTKSVTAAPVKSVPTIENQKKTVQKNTVNTTKKTAKEQKSSPAVSRELALAVKEFQLMVTQAKPAHDLIERAVKISLLCGVQRCVFSVKVPGKEMLVSRYTAQIREDIAIESLKVPVNNPHVFTLLMEKSRNLFLNDSNRQKYWNGIPSKVKLKIGVEEFFAVSIFAKSHAMGLMYADKVKGELTHQEFTNFQGVCRLLSKGIVQSAHNKKAFAQV